MVQEGEDSGFTWNWADEQLDADIKAPKRRGIWGILKTMVAFADEAIIILVIAYVIYRLSAGQPSG
jgi:hypothetical protein